MGSTSKRHRPPAPMAMEIPPPFTASTESDYAFTLIRTAVAQICSSIGFSAAEAPALGILSDIATRYLRSIAKSAADSANLACRTESNLVDTITAVNELSSVRGFPGAWRTGGCFLNSGTVKQLAEFTEDSKEIPFVKPLPRKIFSVGSRKGLTCRTESNLVDTITAVNELSSVRGFPGAWRTGGCFLNSGTVEQLAEFTEDSKEIPFVKPLPRKIFSVGSRKGLRNVGSSSNEYIGGERKHVPRWLPVMPVIENQEEEIIEKSRRELWGYCGKTEETEKEKKEEAKIDNGEKEERKGIELSLKRGKVRFKIGGNGGGGVLGGGVCRRRGGIGKRVLCENWNFDDEKSSKQEQLDGVTQQKIQ